MYCISWHFPAIERFESVNAESSDGEEGKSQPESQSSSNTRDQIYRLHHVILLKHLTSHLCYLHVILLHIPRWLCDWTVWRSDWDSPTRSSRTPGWSPLASGHWTAQPGNYRRSREIKPGFSGVEIQINGEIFIIVLFYAIKDQLKKSKLTPLLCLFSRGTRLQLVLYGKKAKARTKKIFCWCPYTIEPGLSPVGHICAGFSTGIIGWTCRGRIIRLILAFSWNPTRHHEIRNEELVTLIVWSWFSSHTFILGKVLNKGVIFDLGENLLEDTIIRK